MQNILCVLRNWYFYLISWNDQNVGFTNHDCIVCCAFTGHDFKLQFRHEVYIVLRGIFEWHVGMIFETVSGQWVLGTKVVMTQLVAVLKENIISSCVVQCFGIWSCLLSIIYTLGIRHIQYCKLDGQLIVSSNYF